MEFNIQNTKQKGGYMYPMQMTGMPMNGMQTAMTNPIVNNVVQKDRLKQLSEEAQEESNDIKEAYTKLEEEKTDCDKKIIEAKKELDTETQEAVQAKQDVVKQANEINYNPYMMQGNAYQNMYDPYSYQMYYQNMMGNMMGNNMMGYNNMMGNNMMGYNMMGYNMTNPMGNYSYPINYSNPYM